MREYKGLYHVFTWFYIANGWYWAWRYKHPSLIERLKDEEVKELILAMNPNLEGESTAMYISRLVKPIGIKVKDLHKVCQLVEI